MDLNYLTGQRPADVLTMRDGDLKDGALQVRQGKSNKLLRIVLEHDGIKSELAKVIERIHARPHRPRTTFIVALPNGCQVKKWHLRLRFDGARKAAATGAKGWRRGAGQPHQGLPVPRYPGALGQRHCRPARRQLLAGT